MTRKALTLAGLFVASYASLLWLTSADHAGDDPIAAGALHAPASLKVAMQADKTHASLPANPQQEIASAEPPPSAQSEQPAQPDAEPVLDTEVQIKEQDALAAAPRTIEAAARALRSGVDRDTRLLAAKSLLLMGRKSIVDPAITQALRDASNDSDPVVAAQANAALVEVERASH